ncbi:MAG: molybdate ABC transporter substrate-binding protein [Gemmatimonadota bacterium]
MRRRLFRVVLFVLAGVVLALGALPSQAQPLTVFAAASLQDAFGDVARLYHERTGRSVRFSFAASSTLARQIEQGAPAAIFASADEAWMDYLQQRKLIAADTRRALLGNRLVLVVPATNPMQVDLRPGFDFAHVLGADGRWVTGDPRSVPAGRYAQQALTRLGVWGFAEQRLVRAENVRVALAFVERGEASAGVVYATDAALSNKVRIAGVFPESSHAPVVYPVAVVAANDSPAARDFLRFLESPDALAACRRFGFSVR